MNGRLSVLTMGPLTKKWNVGRRRDLAGSKRK